MRILALTTLFPNRQEPLHGLFVRARLAALGRLAPVRVIVPVFGPGWLGRGRKVRKVPRSDRFESLTIDHPRYFNFRGVFKSTDARLLARSIRSEFHRIADEFRPDCVDAHWAYPDGAAAALLARERGLPYFLTVRGDDLNVFLDTPARRRQIVDALAGARRVIAVCNDLKQRAVATGVEEERCTVIPNGVDCELFQPRPREEARKKLGLPPDAGLFLSVGRLSAEKGLDLLLTAFSAPQGPEAASAFLVLVGPGREGPVGRRLKTLAGSLGVADRVRFAGPCPPEGLADYYSAADAFCLASTREGWPNVLLEALACGCPVVAANVGGVPEVVSDPACGILASRTPEAFAGAMQEALRRPFRREDLVAYARARSWDRTAEACLQLFRKTLHGAEVGEPA